MTIMRELFLQVLLSEVRATLNRAIICGPLTYGTGNLQNACFLSQMCKGSARVKLGRGATAAKIRLMEVQRV